MIILFIFDLILIKLNVINNISIILILNYFIFSLNFSSQISNSNYINKTINLLFILISSLWILTTNSLFSLWLALECQSFCIVMLVLGLRPLYLLKIEGLINYLFIMTFSGILFVVSLHYYFSEGFIKTSCLTFPYSKNKIFISLLTLSYCCKIGFFPFFFWVKNFFESLTLIENFLYIAVPKLTMLIVMVKLNLKNDLFFLLGYLTVLVSSIQGLNQTNLKSILAYSSLSNLGMLSILFVNSITEELTNFFIFYYIFLNLGFLAALIYGNWTYIIELPINSSNHKFLSLLIFFYLLNLMGFPPFNVFFFKVSVFYSLICNSSNLFLIVLLIIPISITTFYYLRIIATLTQSNVNNYFFFKNLLTNKKENKNKIKEFISFNFVVIFSIILIYYVC